MRAIVIADSGTVFAQITRALAGVDGVQIVRHVSGRSRVDRLMRSFTPDLVVIDAMGWPPLALARVEEVRRAVPAAAVVVHAHPLEGTWLADALRIGAAALMPAGADPTTLATVLTEVIGHSPVAA
jgi:DNA-binding NarL/FixJ family response regulator